MTIPTIGHTQTTPDTLGSACPPAAEPEPATKSRERLLFETLAVDHDDTIAWDALPVALERSGLLADDPRLRDSLATLDAMASTGGRRDRIGFNEFRQIIGPTALMVTRALERELVVPEFEAFADELDDVFERTRANKGGKVADYIPQLARIDPEQYGAAVCSTDGQRRSFGDAQVPFCVQSCCKPVNYSLALEEGGRHSVHDHIGCEPSGQSFNELTLNRFGRPHNPMINAGAIMSCSLIQSDRPLADRFDHVMEMWTRLSGGHRPGFNNPTYLSERRTADRNFALGYFMREKGAFPRGTDLVETLEFYFQCCSIEMTTESMSVVAATLANGGICPLTGERVLKPDTVQKCLSLMYSCGMYDFSGEWAFSVGLPAKSGVSGAVLIVVPNVMGLCTWSPRLDDNGNSVRGIEFGRELVSRFNFHNYDSIADGHHDKIDPRVGRESARRNLLVDLCWAASEGDVDGVRRLALRGADLNGADYDGRTALHLAASEGRVGVVEYFIEQAADLEPVDRWGNTPLDDARRAGNDEVQRLIEEATGR